MDKIDDAYLDIDELAKKIEERIKELEKTSDNLNLGLENEYTFDDGDEDPVIKPEMVDVDEEII